MTQLFNLESYVECCQYAQLFHQSPEQLIPQDGDLPRTYKAFLQNYTNYPYLKEAITCVNRPQQLTINRTSVDYLLIGTQLTQGEKQRLFIIRDTVDLMTLSMSNLLEHKDGYLYSSAYYYWNHYSQICQHQLTKPLVFINLDNFVSGSLIPINFSRLDNSPYQVPILNTKNPIFIDLNYNSIELYNNICQSIASRILVDNFSAIAQNCDTVNHLANYLQKISFFQIIQPHVGQEYFDFIIEILHNNQIYYKKVTLALKIVVDIVFKQISIQYLKQLASKHPKYQFALISQYNIFPHIQQLLPEFICLNPSFQQFNQIWHEKSKLNFPLFGIYLDEIEFAIAMQNSRQWIQLFNQQNAISYEGKPTVLRGYIPSRNQDFFRIPQGNQTAKLPIKVNGNDYYINGVPQDYNIEIENQVTEDVCIRIEFHLQPGSFPELKVTDLEGKYKITASLTDRIQSLSYSYIPPEKITSTRQQESSTQINRLKIRTEVQQLKQCLVQLAKELDSANFSGNQPINYTRLKNLFAQVYNQLNRTNNKPDLLQFVDVSFPEVVVDELKIKFEQKNLHKIVDIICKLMISLQSEELNNIKKDVLIQAIKILGKTYQFSQYLLTKQLFCQTHFITANQITTSNLSREYLQCFARVAINKELQNFYFNWFDSNYQLENSQYLWGYGRILLWYYNFEAVNLVNYQAHFTAILQYLLSKPYTSFNKQYKQNAFLSLLYLLSFRATDKYFCQHNSQEMRMAESVINHFSHDRIILNTVSREKPLNQFFQEMIAGTTTEDDLGNLVQS